MKSETRLDSAVFQLTPTRTRCDLVIIANGRSEKLASGLLSPFLTHLKTAQDQIAKGGYSIILEPSHTTDAFWFTKGTVERFVRFVSTPEVLERVNTIESEILQIEEAITIQGNENIGLSTSEEHQTKSTEYVEGSKPMSDADAERAIVLYKPGSQSNPSDSNGSVSQEENSKAQLLRVLETRKIVLQKEQGMAFARAAAAGFDMDHMAHLITFAECFGASRLKEACLKFMDLWRVKHETGQWFEVEAAEAISMRSGFSPFNASGIVLAGTASGGDLGTESTGNDAATNHACDKRIHSDHHGPADPHEYFHGQLPQPSYPPWVMHPQPGPPVFQPYPMQGMPYYQNYPGSGSFYQPPYPPTEDPRFNTQHRLGRRRSKNSKDDGVDSETSTRSLEDDADQSLSESEKEKSHGHKSSKWGGRSGKKKSSMVVIKNLNYITSKNHGRLGNESQSASDAECEDETEGSHSDAVEIKNKKSSRSSKKEDPKQSLDEMIYGNDADSGNWRAFQNFLLRAEENMTSTIDGDMFACERESPIKRKQKIGESEPILTPERESSNFHEARIMKFDSVSGKVSCTRQMDSNDEMLASIEGRDLRESPLHAQFIEIESGGAGYRKMAGDDFMIYGQGTQITRKNSLDPLAEHVYENAGNLEKTSYVATDESFIVPLRSGSIDQLETDKRIAIDMYTEFPLSYQREDLSSNANNQLSYEPDDLTMMPARAIEREYFGYDPAIDYDMQIAVGVVAKQETRDQEDDLTSTNEEPKKSDKEKKLKNPQNGLEKRKKDTMMRRGAASKLNPLTEAQKRAEKLRAFKVDLQKARKANEEEERKRLEALKIERQKRIAARSSSNSVQSPSATKQTRTGLPTKVSPNSFKGTRMSDSEPGSNSPLRKIPIRNSLIESSDSQKTIKTSRSNGSTNGLTKLVSSLPDLKTEKNGVITEVKAVASRTKRLSDPNVRNVQLASQKAVATDHRPKDDVSNGPQMKKISAIELLDKTKSATLPELKIRTPRGTSDTVENKLAKEILQQGSGSSATRVSESVKENMTNQCSPRVSNCDDNPVIEKTVVMLENEMVSGPSLQTSEGMTETTDAAKEKSVIISEYAAIRAPRSPIVMEEVKDPSQQKSDDHVDCYEVVNDFSKDNSHNSSNSVTENFYQAPYARTSSLEDHVASLEYTGLPTIQSELASIRTESIKPWVSNFPDSSFLEQTTESVEKPRSKESKGFRKLLKFGTKSHISASCEANMDSGASLVDDQIEGGSSNDVHMLKNLISEDDDHAGGTPPKGHRHFSILSPFRSSKNNDKKLAV